MREIEKETVALGSTYDHHIGPFHRWWDTRGGVGLQPR